MRDLLILKIGGSVITDKKSEKPKINEKNIKRICKEIASAYNKQFSLIIVLGAGSYAHPLVKKTGIDKGIQNKEQLLAFAQIQRQIYELNSIVAEHLIKENLPAFPCQTSMLAIMDSGRISEFNTSPIEGLLEIDAIPILSGVAAYDINQKCSILSGDKIAPYLALKLRAKKIIHSTDVDGIFTTDPKLNPNARLIQEINSKNVNEVLKKLSGSTNIDVTGGMLGKISELMDVGIESQIINALIPNNITKALKGENVGTIITF